MNCSLWKYWELESLPSSTIALIEDSVWVTVCLRDLHPLMHRIELLRSAKLTIVLINPTTSAYGSEVLSLSLNASLVMVFDADGPAPPVVTKTSGLKELCLIFMIRCSYLRFFEASWCLYASWICFGQELAKGLKILTSTRVPWRPPFVYVEALASNQGIYIFKYSSWSSLSKVFFKSLYCFSTFFFSYALLHIVKRTVIGEKTPNAG